MSKNLPIQTLQMRIAYFSQIIIAVAVMIWSARNFWNNVLQFRASQDPQSSWGLTTILILVLTVVPFCVGVGMLLRSLNAKQPSP